MVDDIFSQGQIEVKRLIDRDESGKSLLEFYDPKDIISVYIYDLIACIIISYVNNIKLKEINKKLDSYLVELILKYKSEEYVDMEYNLLKELVENLNSSKISEITLRSFVSLYCIKEKLIDIEYLQNLRNNLTHSKTPLWKFCYKVKPKYDVSSKLLFEEMLTQITKETSRKVFEEKYGVTITSVKNNKTNKIEFIEQKEGKKVK